VYEGRKGKSEINLYIWGINFL